MVVAQSISQILLYCLGAVALAAIIWRVYERRLDTSIFTKDKTGVFRNLHTKAALYAFDHVEGLQPVDVRSEKDFRDGHIPGAVNAPYDHGEIDPAPLESIDRTAPLLVYCDGGYASRKSVDILKNLGFHTIYHIHRGFASWQFFGGATEETE